jgi:hypothetical protein
MTNEERQRFSRRLRERDAEIEHLRTTLGYLADNISDYPALVAVAEAALKPRP